MLWGFKMRPLFIHSPSAYWVPAVGCARHSIDWVTCAGKSLSHDLFCKVWCRVSRRGNTPSQLAVGSRCWCSGCSWVWCLLDKRPMWWRRPPSRQLLASVIGDSAKLAPIGLRFFSLTHIFLHQPLCLSLFWASERPLFTSSFSGCCCTSLENSPGPSHEGRFSSSLCFHASPYFSSHLSQFLITH